MRIFADRHHSGLASSLKYLFEDRLKHELFFPLGMEWFPDWWDIAKPYGNNLETAKQYLDLSRVYAPTDGTPPLNAVIDKGTHYDIEDSNCNVTLKGITLEQFKSMKFDIIIASIPDHARTYKKLRDQFQPQAKLVFQMGNMFIEIYDLIKEGYIQNLLASTIPFQVDCNSVFYHQELSKDFSLRPISEALEQPKPIISSFVIGLPEENVYLRLKSLLNEEFDFHAYASHFEPFIGTTHEIADKMGQSMWGLQQKKGGDGFGHVLHAWAFVGRPIIGNFSYYRGQLGEQLLTDGMTGIDIANGDFKYHVDRIRQYSTPRNFSAMSLNISNRIRSLIDYQKEQERIEVFLSQLV